MSAKIYCGNLSWGTNSDSLRDAFSQFGQVVDCIVMTEPGTGRSRGFGFVTFADQAAADAAIQTMNEQELVRPRFSIPWQRSTPFNTSDGLRDARRCVRKRAWGHGA
ncbi:RRM domain-containing protein [Rhodotorula toruloides]|nr:RRM domain-containing protein [Rhodotorula toruloides]